MSCSAVFTERLYSDYRSPDFGDSGISGGRSLNYDYQ